MLFEKTVLPKALAIKDYADEAVQKEIFWTVPDFLMNKPLPKALKVNFYAVFGSLASQKLHTINPLVPSADKLKFAAVQNQLFGQPHLH
jgi:hypothetical protein